MTTELVVLPKDAVVTKDGHATTTSLKVAAVFGKDHKNVLRDIEALEIPEDFRRLNFEPSSYINGQGKEQPMMEIAKDGLVYLVMGYKGEKASQLKLAYIRRFNEMEEAHKRIAAEAAAALPDSLTPDQFEKLLSAKVVLSGAEYMALKSERNHLRLVADPAPAGAPSPQPSPARGEGVRRPLTREERHRILDLAKENLSQNEIARRMDRNHCTIGRYLRKFGGGPKRPRKGAKKVTAHEVAFITRSILQGQPFREVAREMKRDESTIRRVCERAGIMPQVYKNRATVANAGGRLPYPQN